MHICQDEIFAVINGIQSIWPGLVPYLNRFKAWLKSIKHKDCKHER